MHGEVATNRSNKKRSRKRSPLYSPEEIAISLFHRSELESQGDDVCADPRASGYTEPIPLLAQTRTSSSREAR
ncbi:hypothetical protein F2Q69_00036595 [Brassica cretica]|uniref:Uncharacterized protein n=2 Tax=Brassica cretica TaxID=69181 RepID=A0ABQ7BAH8_BRACR|nr:hypothetical protein DY000_02041158 [Brassica cretica]KAF3601823.1 hypothetical protein F2Q69_00036595 [Brassica cretica]